MRSDGRSGFFNGTWDQFFEHIIKEKRGWWGDFFEINAEWYIFHEGREKSLVLMYEDMKKDHRGHVVQVAKFFGYDLSDEAIDKVVQVSTFKASHDLFEPLANVNRLWDKTKAKFIRKGEVGDWKNYFSQEQIAWVDEQYSKHLEPLGIKFEYEI